MTARRYAPVLVALSLVAGCAPRDAAPAGATGAAAAAAVPAPAP